MAQVIDRSVKCTLLVIFMMFVWGCHPPMALNKKITKLDLTKESIAIMSIKVSNEHVLSCQPFLNLIVIGKGEDVRYKTFKIKSVFAQEKGKYNEYLISVDLPAGKYMITDVIGESSKILPPLWAVTYMPVYLPFELKPNEITYLGRIEGTIRKKQNDDELIAGAVVPLVDQALAGFSNGTYDIIVTDSYNVDITHFTQECPILKKYTVTKSILPSWKKPAKETLSFLPGR